MSPRDPAAALLLLASALLPAPPASAEEDALRTFEKEFPATVALRGDPTGRVNALTRLATFDTAEGARILMSGLEALYARYDADLENLEKIHREYAEVNVPLDVRHDNYKTRTELQNRIMAEEASQREDAKVFDAFLVAVRKYQDAKSLGEVISAAKRAKSWRLTELLAEGLAGNEGGAEAAIRLGKDKDARIVAAALRGLRVRKSDPAVRKPDYLFKFASESLRSESWAVRAEAAVAMEWINEPRVLPPLIEALSREDGRVKDDMRDVLRRLTGQNFDSDGDIWKRWWVDNHQDIEGGSGGTALFGAFKGKNPPPERKSVYGIETRSRRILFIIDVSGSMREEIHRPGGGTPTGLDAEQLEELNGTKIDIAKRELKRAVKALEVEATFNILAFSTDMVVWKEKMAKGDMATKNQAYEFIRNLEAAGGTWAYGALEQAFRMGGYGVVDKNYVPSLDTIYFISDGAPTDNSMEKPQLQDPEIILSAVREWNRLGKVVIHAVAVDPRAAGASFVDFMKKLAKQNGGEYTQRE